MALITYKSLIELLLEIIDYPDSQLTHKHARLTPSYYPTKVDKDHNCYSQFPCSNHGWKDPLLNPADHCPDK